MQFETMCIVKHFQNCCHFIYHTSGVAMLQPFYHPSWQIVMSAESGLKRVMEKCYNELLPYWLVWISVKLILCEFLVLCSGLFEVIWKHIINMLGNLFKIGTLVLYIIQLNYIKWCNFTLFSSYCCT